VTYKNSQGNDVLHQIVAKPGRNALKSIELLIEKVVRSKCINNINRALISTLSIIKEIHLSSRL
jgi:hypothetical protein